MLRLKSIGYSHLIPILSVFRMFLRDGKNKVVGGFNFERVLVLNVSWEATEEVRVSKATSEGEFTRS